MSHPPLLRVCTSEVVEETILVGVLAQAASFLQLGVASVVLSCRNLTKKPCKGNVAWDSRCLNWSFLQTYVPRGMSGATRVLLFSHSSGVFVVPS